MAYNKLHLGPGNKLEQIAKHYGMLSSAADIIYYSMILDFFPNNGKLLELGTYIGGSLLFANECLKNQNKVVEFTTVDDMQEIGSHLSDDDQWNTARQQCSADEYKQLTEVKSTEDACNFVKTRSMNLTNNSIDIRWFTTLSQLDNTEYDLIFQDFGFGYNENISILNQCLPKLKDDGIYIVDDYDSPHIARIITTLQFVQEKKLFPILWGYKKAFFAKSVERAEELIKLIVDKNPQSLRLQQQLKENDRLSLMRFDKPYPPLGINYSPLVDLGVVTQ